MKERLELLRESFQNTPVKIIVIEDISPLTLPDGSVFSARRGEETEVPRWIADYLEKKGLVKRKWGEITLDDIIKIHYREINRRATRELESLPTNFYWLVREYIEHLDKLIKENPDPVLLDEKRKVTLYLQEIVEKRLQALAFFALSNDDSSTISQKLAPEENVLLEELKASIKMWKKTVLGFKE